MIELCDCEKCGHFLEKGEYESRIYVADMNDGRKEFVRDILYYKCTRCGHVGP
jgi:hypothetical protein